MTNTPAGAENATSQNDGNDRPADGGGDNTVRTVVGRAVGGGAGANDVAHRLHEQTALARELLAQVAAEVDGDDDMAASVIEGETDLNTAIASAVQRLANINIMQTVMDLSMKQIAQRHERLAKQRDNLRDLLCLALDVSGQKRVELPMATVSLKRVPPKVEVTDESAIPLAYWKPQPPKLDKKALADALKANQAVPGATLSNGDQTIQVTFS